MIRFGIILFLFCRFVAAIPEDLTLPIYSLEIDANDLYSLNANPYSEQYYPAVFHYKSHTYSCMVRYRGDTSRDLPKKSYKIKFDSNDTIFLTDNINLNAEYEDKTLMRNYLGHVLFRNLGQYAPAGEYISLIINNQYYGVYHQIEQVDKFFFINHNLEVTTCFKGYNGADMSPFLFHHLLPIVWSQKIGSSIAYDRLELFMNKITYWTESDFRQGISDEIDISAIISYFALIYAINDYDGIHKNFYFFQSGKNSPYSIITWDMDSSFGNDPDGVYHKSYETSSDIGILSKHVLFLRLMEIPAYRQLFREKIAEISDQGFQNLLPLIETTFETIKNDLYQDEQKICTNDEFDQAVEQLKTYLENRKQFLNEPLTFQSLSLSEPYCSHPKLSDDNKVIFRIKSAKKQKITLYLARNLNYGYWGAEPDVENFDLFDDGLHNDQDADDLIYGNELTLTDEHQGVMHYAFYTVYDSSPLHGFFYIKYHTHIGPAINMNVHGNEELNLLHFGDVMQLEDEYIVPIINPTVNAVDLSHFHIQAGPYYQRIVFPVPTIIGASDTLFLTSNLELMQELYPSKNFIEHIYFDINSGDTLKLLSPTYSEERMDICSEIIPLSGVVKDIVITEINYDSNINHDTKDWVELYNPNRFTANISNWFFQDSKTENIFLFPNDSKIPPYGTVILCRDRDAFQKYYTDPVQIMGDFGFNLKSDGEYICLKNESGTIKDSLTYRSTAPWPENTNGTGYTLMLNDVYADNADGNNWRASGQIGGTPGTVLDLTISNQKVSELPKSFILDQNYPNPFNASTTIRYFLLKSSYVELKLFTITGQLITIFESAHKDVGCYTRDLHIDNLSSGLYIYSLFLDNHPVASRKALLIK
jgi:spore coat protein H